MWTHPHVKGWLKALSVIAALAFIQFVADFFFGMWSFSLFLNNWGGHPAPPPPQAALVKTAVAILDFPLVPLALSQWGDTVSRQILYISLLNSLLWAIAIYAVVSLAKNTIRSQRPQRGFTVPDDYPPDALAPE